MTAAKIRPDQVQKRRQNMSINVIFTAKNIKYMHVGFAINVIQTAKYRKYMHIEMASS